MLASLLLLTLLTGVAATSLVLNLGTSSHVKTWLSDSKLYDHFIANVIKQSVGSKEGDNSSSTGVSPTDPVVQDAAAKAFSPQLLQTSVNTFLDNNYQWLQGKIAQPNFVIDLTVPKQQFATYVANAIQTHLASVPTCTKAQAAQVAVNFSPLDATCLPAGVNARSEAAKVQAQLAGSNGLLSNPVITAQSLNTNGNSTPYYEHGNLANLPKYYKLAVALPLLLAGVAVVLILGVIFIHPVRRRGVLRVGVVLLTAGLLLVVVKFIADFAYPKVIAKAFNKSDVGPLQVSLTDFAHRAEAGIIGTDMYLGLCLVLIAIAIFIGLSMTRTKKAQPTATPKPITTEEEPVQIDEEPEAAPLAPLPAKPKPVVNDFVARPSAKKQTTSAPAPVAQKPPIKKRPRLIQ